MIRLYHCVWFILAEVAIVKGQNMSMYVAAGPIAAKLYLHSLAITSLVVAATSLIDAYSPTCVLSSPATVPLGTTVVLVCRVGGVASGTQLSYTWTCANGPCDVGEGNNPNRKTYRDRMVLNVLTSRDGGTYTCLVRAEQDAVHGSNFTLNVQGELWIVHGVQ